MTPPVHPPAPNQPFTGWDELRSGAGPAWRIEPEQPIAPPDDFVPFFPGPGQQGL